MDTIENVEELRESYGVPSERSLKKQLSRLDKHCRDFIARSPFLVIASADPSGRCDASPKGDAPGFVQVIDDTTLLIPDRLGNNRVDTIGNLLARPGVGLIFFVPGLNETCMGLFLSSSRFGLLPFFVRGGKAVLRPVACDQVRGARGRGQGTETLAKA